MSEAAREFAEQMANIMRSILESGREAMPACFIRKKSGEVTILGFDFPEGDGARSKDMAAVAMRLMMQLPEVEYIVFLSDAWVARVKPGESLDYSEGVRNIPGRKECIIASLFGRERLTELGQWHYERVEGRAVFTPAMEWMVPEHAEGRFVMEQSTTRSRQ